MNYIPFPVILEWHRAYHAALCDVMEGRDS
jgi:hypothetical protein